MFIWPGRQVLVSLSDGSTLSARAAWSWSWRVLRLKGVMLQSDGEPVPADGIVLVPVLRIVIVQVTS
jgi:hypothetical protein